MSLRMRSTTASSGAFFLNSGYRLKRLINSSNPARFSSFSRIRFRRVSASPVTEDLTNPSGICCCSTRTVAVELYKFGRLTARLSNAAAGIVNNTMPSHFLRRHTSIIAAANDRLSWSCMIAPHRLRNDDDVARLQKEIFQCPIVRHDLVIVERNLAHGLAFRTKDD